MGGTVFIIRDVFSGHLTDIVEENHIFYRID
jgi:hypothetical protein